MTIYELGPCPQVCMAGFTFSEALRQQKLWAPQQKIKTRSTYNFCQLITTHKKVFFRDLVCENFSITVSKVSAEVMSFSIDMTAR